MAKVNPHRPFTPDPAQMALMPNVSGNAVNGLGEVERRRPRVVYWAVDPDTIAHGAMQRWFYGQADDPVFHEERAKRQHHLDAPLPAVAAQRVARDPDDWTAALDQFVAHGLCDKAGAAVLDPDWAYEGHDIAWQRIIVLGVHHDPEKIRHAPGLAAGREVMRQYTRAAGAAKAVAAWLHEQGWAAEPVTGPLATTLTLIPPAMEAGFGELGKHGSLINPEFGASFRLSAVMTDAPFAATGPRQHGIDAFCQSCRICEDACPPEALSPMKQTVRGVEKWYVDFDRCLPFFNETAGCAICIAVCPWSRPGVGLNLAAKLTRRAERLEGAAGVS